MHVRSDDPILRGLLCCLTMFALLLNVTGRGEFSESELLISFIQSVDPENHIKFKGLVPSSPCFSQLEGIKCLPNSNSVVEVSFDNNNLSGIINTDTLCSLPNLQVVNLAKNHIHGNIPVTVSRCSNLRYLNLSSNLLNGTVPSALYKMKNLEILDISNNLLTSEANVYNVYSVESHANSVAQNDTSSAPAPTSGYHAKRGTHRVMFFLELVLAIALLVTLVFVVIVLMTKTLKKKNTNNTLQSSPKTSVVTSHGEVKMEERHPDLVFFVEEEQQFKLENLLDAGADLQNQNFMAKVGKINHPNILPLVAYSCQGDEKLLIYKYQNKGSLLSLMERYVEGKRDFPWKLRLSIAVGIARGLDHIYRSFKDSDVIPHGNLKLSNILLNENEEPLISEYGYSYLLDPKSASLFKPNGYTAPERCLSEQGDVFSFGVILLELLTGKMVENSGLDLPKWVKAMVREEWTGEVFDKEVAKVGMYGFPLLNVSLKCVAHFAENRPSMAEVLETIVGVVDEDLSTSSVESSPHDGHVLYSVAEEEV